MNLADNHEAGSTPVLMSHFGRFTKLRQAARYPNLGKGSICRLPTAFLRLVYYSPQTKKENLWPSRYLGILIRVKSTYGILGMLFYPFLCPLCHLVSNKIPRNGFLEIPCQTDRQDEFGEKDKLGEQETTQQIVATSLPRSAGDAHQGA